MHWSTRSDVDPFLAMEAFRAAAELSAQGAEVLHLSLGQPGHVPPRRVLEYAAKQAVENPPGYTDAPGMMALRVRIARHYRERYGAQVSPERVFVTVGSSQAYAMAMLLAFDVGARVMIVAPHYPASPAMMRALGIEPIVVRATMNDNYQPTLAMLKAQHPKPDGLVIASPSNPAGTVIDAAELEAITRYCEAEGIRIISDEIYHGITYGERKARSMLELSQDMIVINSFSKFYLLPGWRLGWAVVPDSGCRAMESLLQNFVISPSSIGQYAALAVMDCMSELDGVVDTYRQNRDTLIDALAACGITRLAPAEGSFYLYADIAPPTGGGLGMDSTTFCRRLLEEAHVCAVPGLDFDKEQGHRFVRFSYSGAPETVYRAGEKLKAWVSSL